MNTGTTESMAGPADRSIVNGIKSMTIIHLGIIMRMEKKNPW